MRSLLVTVALLMLPCVAAAQVNPRQQMQALTRNVYMRERVQEGCSTGAREFLERINGPGSEFPVDCLARLSWLKSWAELYRLASECDSTESETVSVLVLGYEVPVSCRNRAADQPLIEKWLPPQ